MNLDSAIDTFLSPIADKISGIIFCSVNINGVEVQLLVALLMAAALYFTFRTGFIGIWGFKHAIKLITKNYEHKDLVQRKKKGEVSSFQALTATISASAGIGNVAGSAAAVSIGGPGVIFWMIIAGFFSMALKFAEVLLGLKFRQINSDGTVDGGPMYYIQNGLKNHKVFGKFAPHLSKIYALCCIFAMIGGWNLFQINAMTTQITKVTPVMCTLYVLTAFTVCIFNIHHLPHTIVLIVKEAFTPQAISGGMFACMLWGFRRAMFANESGLGTAPIAFSAVKTSKPVVQAFIAMLQPFVDTVIVGSATAFVIVVSGVYLNNSGLAGIELTSKAFGSVCPFFPILLTFMASCFVLSTMLCGSYYGIKSWNFLFGNSKWTTRTFQIIYCLFIVIGSAMNFKSIINLSDAFTLFLAVPNLFAVFILSEVVMKDLKRYCKKYNVGLFKNNTYEQGERENERTMSGNCETKV